ncbi:serine/threonine protein kinase [Amycolatopsis antarctica]|uniref:non-specific serine/threonine protein kinase n=1 Tax=Amycolatopsis antarctica TaxID=1854586 RepID=A0A263D7F5_9PSEU|nr:serine/threonine-protein kinase [Amycolatopsis antarctica]OZM74099.1 serine/threonine protein kinase [Amycolatopsis antarctica]
MSEDDEGRLVAGRYRLQRRIGGGAMGVVWQARDETLARTVAAKQLRVFPGLSAVEGEQARQRAFREGRIAARLQHPHAILVYDVADDAGQPVLVMEYLPSRSLAEVLDERGVLPPREVAGIGAHAASALAAAHIAGIVHRDVKPGNVLLGEDGTTKITDFGISRAVGDVAVTQTGLLAGTPAYLAPEAARGVEPGPASDVFSLGATLYAAVEGQPPFGTGTNEIAMLHAVASGRITPPRQAGPLTGWLSAMLRAEPEARPTMTQVRAGLAQVAATGRDPSSAAAAPAARIPTRTMRPVDGYAGSAAPVAAERTAAERTAAERTAAESGSAGAAAPAATSKSRSGRRAVLTALALVAAVAVGVLATTLLTRGGEDQVADGGRSAPPSPAPPPASSAPSAPVSSSPPASSTSSTPPPTTSTPPPAVGPEQVQKAVADYYAVVTRNGDDAWKRLGPDLQAQGRKKYDDFWKRIKDLKVVSAPKAINDNTAEVGIEFTMAGEGRFREVHRITTVTSDGVPLLQSDTPVSSKQVKGKKNDDDEGEN